MASGDVMYEFTNLQLRSFDVNQSTNGHTSVEFEIDAGSDINGGTGTAADGGAIRNAGATVSFGVAGTNTGSGWDYKGGTNPFNPDKKYKLTITEV